MKMKANKVVIVPETHWDREWYLPFQEYRARLVIMLDKLLKYLKTDPEYKNFTFDGQVIPIEDYLEVRPDKEEEITKFVKEGKLSIGPMYILPDEFLISGESMIRNLIIGHQLSKKFGDVMKAGYIPDPFGHIAQLPQILSGFEVPSVLFARGFGNEFEENDLNMEFTWNAPGNAASVMGIHLIEGYGSVAGLNASKKDGIYSSALRRLRRAVRKLEKHIAAPIVLLNNGSDHHEALAELPEIIQQWNAKYPDKEMVQNDFEYYVRQVMEKKPNLKSYQGELRGGRYNNLLSGVFSARMWIKQRNTAIEYLYQYYTEPASTIAWLLNKSDDFIYPKAYLLAGLKWLIKNHPHDSICGCSIDQVHDEMETRFDWAEQIGDETFKDAMVAIADRIKEPELFQNKKMFVVYNPLPWKRTDVVNFLVGTSYHEGATEYPEDLKLIDHQGKEIPYQSVKVDVPSRYRRELLDGYSFSFISEMPACGYKVYYLVPGEEASKDQKPTEEFQISEDTIENQFFKISVNSEGIISCLDKESGMNYENICELEDVGDWGDEYDYSPPENEENDKKFTTSDASQVEISPYLDGATHKTLKIKLLLKLPASLTPDRKGREKELIENPIELYISLYKDLKRLDFRIKMDNQSKDHRIRALFSSNVRANQVYADGHFYVIPRDVELPEGKKWFQKPLPTNHQKDFVVVSDQEKSFGVVNKGLPEYEAIENEDGEITLAITLLRCIEWLSRTDLTSRKGTAGPDLHTPGAQCLGAHEFELSLFIEGRNANWLDSGIHIQGKEFNNPLKVVAPYMVKSQFRLADKMIIMPNIELILGSTRFSEDIEDKYLPPELSFLEIENKKIMLSALKKAEVGDSLILRAYNLSSSQQETMIRFTEKNKIDNPRIVNFLEETPKNDIKAEISETQEHQFKLSLGAHVIASIELELKSN
ncbi:MAG: hypothetical protein EU548_00965 [Promethearchaeota archaeon]|nr:MAG: hypothetical protein EU548_00965 [Candidatus Lokiarchaeota archaeon]